jgi:hypothetical protein
MTAEIIPFGDYYRPTPSAEEIIAAGGKVFAVSETGRVLVWATADQMGPLTNVPLWPTR